MNSLVMAMIKFKTNLLAKLLLHIGYTLAAFLIIFVYIVATFGIILSTFGKILATFWLHSGYFLDTFWIHFGYILASIIATFRLHSCHICLLFGYIFGTFWIHDGYILATFRLRALNNVWSQIGSHFYKYSQIQTLIHFFSQLQLLG